MVARQRALSAGSPIGSLLAQWRDGRIKQAIIALALQFRSRSPALFTEGSYIPLRTDGLFFDHVVAYARVLEGRTAIIVGTRLSAALLGSADVPHVATSGWRDTSVLLPRSLTGRRAMNVLSGSGETLTAPRMLVSDILKALPVALLEVR